MALKTTRSYIEALTTALSNDGKVKFKEGKFWRVNMKSKTLEYNTQDLLNQSANVVKGLIIHETGHLKYTSDSGSKDKNKQMIYNVLEDMRIEKKLTEEYGDFADQALSATNYAGLKMVADRLQQDRKTNNPQHQPISKLQQALMTILAHDAYDQKRFLKNDLCNLSQQIQENIEPEVRQKIDNNGSKIVDIMRKSLTAGSTKEIIELADKELIPILKDFIKEEPEDNKPLEMLTDKKGIGLDKAKEPENNDTIPPDKELESLLSPYFRTLTRKLHDILKEKSTIKYTGSYKQGRLLTKNTYKVFTNERRIFSKRNRPEHPKYAIYLLLDESGSMRGKKHAQTYIATYLIKRACELLNFKIRLVQYGNESREIKELLAYRQMRGGGNDDRKGLETVYNMIDRQDENIIFHLTDGQLCTKIEEMLEKFKKIQALVIGVGIETEHVRKNFPNHLVVPQVQDLPKAMISLLQKLIHR